MDADDPVVFEEGRSSACPRIFAVRGAFDQKLLEQLCVRSRSS